MTKVLLVSDSHGMQQELKDIVAKHQNEVSYFFHCGDSELESDDVCLKPFSVVGGNCDFLGDFPEELVKDIDGFRFFVTHGHRHSVKSSFMMLQYRGEETGAQIICFGHTHMLGAEMIHNKLFINPGSLRLPRGRKERTYCILELSGDAVELRVYDLDEGELENLRTTFIFSS